MKVLNDHGKTYGYVITPPAQDLSGRTILLTEGALEPTLHRIEAEGLLKTEKDHERNRIRKYYVLTPAGKSSAQERVTEFVEFIRTMGNVLQVQLS